MMSILKSNAQSTFANNTYGGEIKVDVSEEGTLEMFNLLGEKVIFTTLVKGTTSISTLGRFF